MNRQEKTEYLQELFESLEMWIKFSNAKHLIDKEEVLDGVAMSDEEVDELLDIAERLNNTLQDC